MDGKWREFITQEREQMKGFAKGRSGIIVEAGWWSLGLHCCLVVIVFADRCYALSLYSNPPKNPSSLLHSNSFPHPNHSNPSIPHSKALALSLPIFLTLSPQILLTLPSYQYRYKAQEYQYFTFNLLPMQPQPSDFVFKILLIGNSAVGKTSLLQRFAQQVFHESLLSTIGVDLKIRTIRNGKTVTKMQVWDTAGQQSFKALSSAAYRDTQGMIMVFDLTDKKTFEDLGTWLDEADRHIHAQYVRILLGNKCDLHATRQVSHQDAQRYAQKQGMVYFQTSAKENINVEAVFERLSGEMKQRFSEQYVEKYKRTKVYLTPIMDAKGGKGSNTCW